MNPNEAAGLLGVSVSAAPDDVQRAFAAKWVEAGPDAQRRDTLVVARDALLAASAWQAPGAQRPPYPAARPQQPPYSAARPQQPPYPVAGPPAPWYPPAPGRRPMSTGAIVGITVGSVAPGLVVLLVALFAIGSIVHSSSRLAQAESTSSAAPSGIPSAEPSPGATDSADVADYDVDGVKVHYVDGWTFELTAGQTCAGATLTAGFSDTPDGDVVDEWSTTIDLQASVPYTLTIPDSASDHEYAGIDTIQCGQA
ncbi:hypothetical protein [Leifsonia sp. 2MCAF36]|uniref:hypothetical protein n=1 Tax=Leifsonia sp. 2MCAF36 TaxID=3232988 RepID=UPI003F9C41B7